MCLLLSLWRPRDSRKLRGQRQVADGGGVWRIGEAEKAQTMTRSNAGLVIVLDDHAMALLLRGSECVFSQLP